MKFTIRFVDQIVGVFIIIALGALVFVIFMLGSSQRWFSRDYYFKTYFSTASGLGSNMPVQFKGFTIGHVKSFDLTDDDRVEVRFSIYDTYISRVRQGSLVEILVSPIGLGNQFNFYPGLGLELVAEGELIPDVNSSEGAAALAGGLAYIPRHEDSITVILNRAGVLLESANVVMLDIDKVLTQVSDAFEGSSDTALGRTMDGVEIAVQGIQVLPENINETLDALMAQIRPIIDNLNEVSEKLNASDGTVTAVLDSRGPVYTSLVQSLGSVSGTLANLEKASAFLPAQVPQLAVLISDLRNAVKKAEDVLVALTNNPLLKGGIPQSAETRSGGTNIRDIEF
ncbi:MAG: MlaD family protein [Treponema sp.]|jgi:phospholipid/cholesterol/gamma-HCH transport system substrate-binding protein|nr:MlaD family protein [Treponema sp.]